ncbi:MAG TPA: DUF1178 family protein [Usitatibacter sp.]|nr:DUF1178 family protein [Usitatibacter sp.]
MIVYRLSCNEGHDFEGWFASAEACEKQAAAGQLQCPSCSSVEVRKLPAAPHVHTSAGSEPARDDGSARRQAIVALRNLILSGTEDVGRRFAEIARRIHYREEEARNIRGQVTAEEAEELKDEGVPAVAIPAGILPTGEVH